MEAIGIVLRIILSIFFGMLWIRFIVDWVQVFARSWSPQGPLLLILELVYSVTDPPIKALRRVIPPLRLGNIAVDLSFMIVLLITYVLLQVNTAIFF